MKNKRLIELREYLNSTKVASYNELCARFQVSKNTIRRDIDLLSAEGILTKTHGGVMLNESAVLPHEQRVISNQEEKRRIGLLAAQLIEANDIIFIDSGTTASSLVPHLPPRITVITANYFVISSLVDMPELELIALGGAYSRRTNSFSGIGTIDTLKSINLTKAFVSATCISIKGGLSNNSYREAGIKRTAIQKASYVAAMVDHSKFDRFAKLPFCELADIDALVTDSRPAEQYLHFFKQTGTKVCY